MSRPSRLPFPLPPTEAILRWASLTAFVAALALAFARMPADNPPELQADASSAPPAAERGADVAIAILQTLPKAGDRAGPAALAELPDGRIAAAWAASRDDAPVAIWLSLLGRSGWSAPRPAMTRESVAAATFMHLQTLGRPQLLAEGNWLHLWVDIRPLAAAWGGIVVHSRSTDGGEDWTPPRRLPTAPLGGLGSGLAGPPLALPDGGIGLPLIRYPFGEGLEWLRLSPTGRALAKTRLTADEDGQASAIAALDGRRTLAVGPPAATGGPSRALLSEDGGRTWRPTEDLALPPVKPHPALLRLTSGRLLLAGNPATADAALCLWLSDDEGRSWRLVRTLEAAADGAADFAWPALLQGRDGRIHLLYTWRRQAIRHALFNEAGLAEPKP